MQASLVARATLRRRLAQPSALTNGATAASLHRSWATASTYQVAWQLQHHGSMSTDAAPPPNIKAAKALAARLRRKAKKTPFVAAGKSPHDKASTHVPHRKLNPKKRSEEEALMAAAATVRGEGEAALVGVESLEATESGVASVIPPSVETPAPVQPPAPRPAKNTQPPMAKVVDDTVVTPPAAASATATSVSENTSAVAVAGKKQQPKALKEIDTDKITMTLKEIETLQKQLPSVKEVASIVARLRRESFVKGQTLFDLYRIYGNPFLDESFLTPGVLACCAAKKPAQGIQIVSDMLEQGRKVDESTLRALLDVCDQTTAAPEVIQLWDLMVKAGVKLELADYHLFLDICHRKEYLDGAIKVLKELRLHRAISVHSYMHWLNQAMIVWRADAFFDLLMEMRLSKVEPEIASLTSLESGRKDRALTVMEGVRAVGLDPCFAMSAVYTSMQFSVYENGPAAKAITASAVSEAKSKFGDLQVVEIDWPTKPIAQVLETQAAGLILQQETFRRLKLHQVHRIDELLKLLPITTNMTINLRKQLQRMSLLVNTHRVKRDARKIAAEYDSGKSLIELSSTHNYPPVSLMRIILKQRGLSTIGIKRALSSPASHVSKRDQNELRKATGYDSMHRSDPFIGTATYNADSLETTLTHFLRSHGIRLKTEDDLGEEQVEKYGRRVISPDILLLDPVIVNGTPIRWIDAKNYYGAHIVSKRLISRQLASYVKEWGPGAIVFGMGYSDMFSVPGVICLDTTPFPKTGTETAKMRAKSMFQSLLMKFSWKKDLGSNLHQEYPVFAFQEANMRTAGKSPRPTTPQKKAEAENDGVDEDEDVDEVLEQQQQAQQPHQNTKSKTNKPIAIPAESGEKTTDKRHQ